MVRVLLTFVLAAIVSAAGTQKAQIFPSLRRHLHPQQQPRVDDTVVDAPTVQEADPSAPMAIPPPANVGADGFPQLPAVTAMLGTATGTMKTINTEASALEAQVVRVEQSNAAKMTQQKAIFEHKLHQQEAKNRAVMAKNDQISQEITSLKKGNLELRKHAKEVSETNHLVRTELRALQSKFGDSKDFIAESLKETDDSKAKELVVLKSSTHHKHVVAELEITKTAAKRDDDDDDNQNKHDDDDDDDDDDEGSDKGESFLAMSSKVRRVSMETEESMEDLEPPVSTLAPQDPKDLVEVLRSGVVELAKEEHDSEKRLKAIFVSTYQEGTKRHQALITQQKVLNTTRVSLTELQQQLRAADKHLENTEVNLQQRLRGIGLFVQRLAHLALAPTEEVSHLIEALPSSVNPAPLPEEK